MWKHFDWRVAAAGTFAGWAAGGIAGLILEAPPVTALWLLVGSPIGAIVATAVPPRKKDCS